MIRDESTPARARAGKGKGSVRKIPSNKACQADQVIILSCPHRRSLARTGYEKNRHSQSRRVVAQNTRKSSRHSGEREKVFYREKVSLGRRFVTFVSDMRGKCIREAEEEPVIWREPASSPSARLTRTNCPVFVSPVPFFIKIKKKFIRTARLERPPALGGSLKLHDKTSAAPY
jgi:hypothetical protein